MLQTPIRTHATTDFRLPGNSSKKKVRKKESENTPQPGVFVFDTVLRSVSAGDAWHKQGAKNVKE